MTPTEAALENLRVIRSLLDKAPIYRAISAPAALAGGGLALVAAAWLALRANGAGAEGGEALSGGLFLFLWMGILVLSSGLNVFLLAREASRRGQPLVSPGMRAALRALAPPLLAGGSLGAGLVLFRQELTLAALLWIVCYGLALVGTANFSPRSLVRLGWTFLGAGLVFFLMWAAKGSGGGMASDAVAASWVMGVTFGLLHVGYALAVFFSRNPGEGRPG